jgi:hypothetical protein
MCFVTAHENWQVGHHNHPASLPRLVLGLHCDRAIRAHICKIATARPAGLF